MDADNLAHQNFHPSKDIFLAEITAVAAPVSDTSGTFVAHGWKEKEAYTNARGFRDKFAGRTGSVTVNPAFSPEGDSFAVGDLVYMRHRGWTNVSGVGDTTYEIVGAAGVNPSDCCPGYLGDDGHDCCDILGGPPPCCGGDCGCGGGGPGPTPGGGGGGSPMCWECFQTQSGWKWGLWLPGLMSPILSDTTCNPTDRYDPPPPFRGPGAEGWNFCNGDPVPPPPPPGGGGGGPAPPVGCVNRCIDRCTTEFGYPDPTCIANCVMTECGYRPCSTSPYGHFANGVWIPPCPSTGTGTGGITPTNPTGPMRSAALGGGFFGAGPLGGGTVDVESIVVPPGSSSGTAETIDSYYTDASNVNTDETDLYTTTLDAGKLAADGDSLEIDYTVTTNPGVSNLDIRLYFGGTNFNTISTSAALTASIKLVIVRVSSSAVRVETHRTISNPASVTCDYDEITGLTLADAQVVKVTGQSSSASDEVTARLGRIVYHAAA